MPTTRDELAQKNFGYLKGSDLLQFAPTQLLTAQYDKFPDSFNQGCGMAYDEINGELVSRYDVSKELSNANQKAKNQTGAFTKTIPATSYLSRIILTWNNEQAIASSMADISPLVKIGTTLGGEEIFTEDNIQYQKVIWVNTYYENQTTLYFNTDGYIDTDLAINTITDDAITMENVYSTKPRNSLFVKIVTILAIRNILGSIAGENKILMNHFEWLDTTLLKLKSRQMSITLDTAPTTIASRASTVESSFKTIG